MSGGLRPAASSVRQGNVPLGLAHNVPLIRAVKEGSAITWDDVKIDRTTDAYKLRTGMEEQLLK